MDTSISSIISAYQKTARAARGETTDPSTSTDSASGDDFASLVKSGVQAAVDAQKQGEETSKLALAGKADVKDLVTALNNAELTLQTVVSVRDKVVTAYNEIMRMSF